MSIEAFPIGNSPLSPAPHIAEAVPHEIPELKRLLDEKPKDINIIFALGNLYFYNHQLQDSLGYFETAIELDKNRAELYTNSAIVMYVLGRTGEAKENFQKALKLDSSFEKALYYLGHLQLHMGDKSSAEKLFSKLARIHPEHIQSLALLASIAEENNNNELAGEYYKRVYQIDKTQPWVRRKLCMIQFQKGKTLFKQKQYATAFSVWSEAHRDFEPSFISDRKIATEFQSLIHLFNKEKQLDGLLEIYAELKLQGNNPDKTLHHELFSAFYFSIGLFPDFYISSKDIKTERLRWEESLKSRGQHPYAHFCIAVGKSYQGQLEDALKEFQLCEDSLLPKKQESLGLKKITAFLKKLIHLPSKTKTTTSSASDKAWVAAGFKDKLQQNLWAQAGFEPKEAQTWSDMGLLAKQAEEWRKQNISPFEAKPWVDSKFLDAKSARTWIRGGLNPQQATKWEKYFSGDTQTAVQCFNAGLKDPKQAKAWLLVFNLPWDAASWHSQGFSPEEAEEWFRKGVSDPFKAKKLSLIKKDAESADEPSN